MSNAGRLRGRFIIELSGYAAEAWAAGNLRLAGRLLEGAYAIKGTSDFIDPLDEEGIDHRRPILRKGMK